MRPAVPEDLNFLVWIDIKDEGVSSTYMANWSDQEWAAHREQIRAFISDPEKIAIVFQESETDRRVAAIYADLFKFEDVSDKWASLAGIKDRFPANHRLCCVFQLWVDPEWRRQGIASQLKQALEDEARRRGVDAMYTQTESENHHVIALNQKLGYAEMYRGPMWDTIERVGLLKMIRV
ncbi:MAG: N-acetyltransferase family protein [Candidatus Sericytochromatia bacterium]